jgi:hypothetical protein
VNLQCPSWVARLLHLGRRFWLSFFVACAIVLSLEAIFDRLLEDQELPGVTQSVFNFSRLYQGIVARPRRPVPRFTVVVELNPLASLTQVCYERKQTAQLLQQMEKALPRVVVLDKYYSPQRCSSDDLLTAAITELRRNQIPVIVGRRVDEESLDRSSSFRYYLRDALTLGDAGTDSEGILNIDPDTRRLPLRWLVFPKKEEAEAAGAAAGKTQSFGQRLRGYFFFRQEPGQQWRDTLALSAARAYDPALLDPKLHPLLYSLLDSPAHPFKSFLLSGYINSIHPFVSFLSPDDFKKIAAPRIVPEETNTPANFGSQATSKIGSSEPKAEAQRTVPAKCKCESLSPELRSLTGKVVLIGELNNDLDRHPSVAGDVPGLYLQANYIEALLDDRYYRNVPILDYAVGFLILIVLDFILTVHCDPWWWKIVLMTTAVVALSVVSLAVLYFCIMFLGWYVNPVPVGAIAILIMVLHVAFGRAEREAEASH